MCFIHIDEIFISLLSLCFCLCLLHVSRLKIKMDYGRKLVSFM